MTTDYPPLLTDVDKLTDSECGLDHDALERQLARVLSYSQRFDELLASAPQFARCAVCGDSAFLDADLSREAGQPAYDCQKCKDRKEQQRLGARLERAGIPCDVQGASLENFSTDRPGVKSGPEFRTHKTPEQFRAAAREFLKKGQRNLILAGSAGIGKGHLAAAIASHFIRTMNWRVRWVECAKLFRDYHRAYESGTNEQITDTLGTVQLLVLDEICLRALPADGEEILFAITDRRHKRALPTIMLGNKPAEDVRAWLGERITDRLRSGGVIFCYGEWESMRGKLSDGANANEF